MASKLDKAVNRARGTEPTAEDRALAVLQGDMADQMETFDAKAIAALVASGQMEAGQQIIELLEGMMIQGQLIGRGEPAMLEDPNKPGTLRAVPTWRMRLTSGANVSFIGAAQLERMLPPFVGRKGITIVARGATEKIKGGKNMTHYFVAGPKADAPPFDERTAVENRKAAESAEDLTQ